ncbi:unnamed protein product [Darwinula stevensoni]|uniref:Neuralized-like protein 2 n=1 Tax=Darwinula stevensoni TaxID=69355 RepID=A0A7R8X821_9CRUS|nr:unnamed protein product [Darwinula stevensoni]CAG0883942.1 unnamed protein product [Darwinula stevensoni]
MAAHVIKLDDAQCHGFTSTFCVIWKKSISPRLGILRYVASLKPRNLPNSMCSYDCESDSELNTSDERSLLRFHPHHGRNLILCDKRTMAYRKTSFAEAVTFSHRALYPGEIFLVEIEGTERGWSGHLRLGLTQLDPSTGFALPQDSLSELGLMGHSWIVAVSNSHIGNLDIRPYHHPGSPKDFLPLKSFPRHLLVPTVSQSVLPTDVGSRIGVFYIPSSEEFAEMHIVVNGADQGVLEDGIPYRDAPLFGVVDVYGTTKQVRVLHIHSVPSLQNACRDVILQRVKYAAVYKLPLPEKLKEYLLCPV